MTNKDLRLPAEWEGKKSVLLAWPHPGTDWSYMLDQVTVCYIDVVRKLTKSAKVIIVAPDVSYVANTLKGYVESDRIELVEVETDDTWARDFGMICSYDASYGWIANDFKFNGWGLKFAACHDNLINRTLFRKGFAPAGAEYCNRLNFVLEGGSIESDGKGTLMTTSECLLSPNRNGEYTRGEIEERLKHFFGAEKVIWLEHGALAGDDTDSHIDTLARFLPDDIIAYTSCDRPEDEHYRDLKLMEQELQAATDANGRQYKLVVLPIPMPIYDEEGQRLPATYANFLIINSTIFMPVYGDEKYDRIALERIKEAAPDYALVPIDCRALIQQHGSLHCITMQLPATKHP